MARPDTARRKAGRPATGETPTVTIRLPAAMIAGLEKIAGERGVSRTDVIRGLIERALVPNSKAQRRK